MFSTSLCSDFLKKEYLFNIAFKYKVKSTNAEKYLNILGHNIQKLLWIKCYFFFPVSEKWFQCFESFRKFNRFSGKSYIHVQPHVWDKLF